MTYIDKVVRRFSPDLLVNSGTERAHETHLNKNDASSEPKRSGFLRAGNGFNPVAKDTHKLFVRAATGRLHTIHRLQQNLTAVSYYTESLCYSEYHRVAGGSDAVVVSFNSRF